MNRKPRALIANEFSRLNSGYGKMGREFLKRLAATGKYELCELATSCPPNDPRIQGLPWHVIGNSPDGSNPEENQAFLADPLNFFGKFRFESALISFKPDHVFSFIDIFQAPFLMESPFRDKYYLHFCAPTDSEPQMAQWLAHLSDCDTVLTYTNYAYKQLSEYQNIALKGIASPAADYEFYRPMIKDKIREFYALEKDAIIIGMACRNQPRKLLSDLCEAFAMYLEKAPLPLARRSYLYLHTTMPDNGFMINELLKEFNLSGRVLFTYLCNNCNKHYPSFYQGEVGACKFCGAPALTTPNTQKYLHDGELAQIFNLFDVYVQYAALGGFEIPVLEASACGIPTFVIDFSCLEDFKTTLHSFPLKVSHYYREQPTHRYFAMPNNEDFVNKLIKYLELPQSLRDKQRFKVSQAARQNYSWDKSAQVWMDTFDSFPLRDPRETWFSPPQIVNIPNEIPQGIDNATFLKWCYINVLGQPNQLYGYKFQAMLKDLNNGMMFNGKPQPVSRESVFQYLSNVRQRLNQWEVIRHQQIQTELQSCQSG